MTRRHIFTHAWREAGTMETLLARLRDEEEDRDLVLAGLLAALLDKLPRHEALWVLREGGIYVE